MPKKKVQGLMPKLTESVGTKHTFKQKRNKRSKMGV